MKITIVKGHGGYILTCKDDGYEYSQVLCEGSTLEFHKLVAFVGNIQDSIDEIDAIRQSDES